MKRLTMMIKIIYATNIMKVIIHIANNVKKTYVYHANLNIDIIKRPILEIY
jgi:hypothetical protein